MDVKKLLEKNWKNLIDHIMSEKDNLLKQMESTNLYGQPNGKFRRNASTLYSPILLIDIMEPMIDRINRLA